MAPVVVVGLKNGQEIADEEDRTIISIFGVTLFLTVLFGVGIYLARQVFHPRQKVGGQNV